MKKIVVTGYTEYGDQPVEKNLIVTGEESMDAHDGYHTFAELYDHRITLFIAFCKLKSRVIIKTPSVGMTTMIPNGFVWKSKKHSDGSEWDGWFILGIDVRPGKQITYHLPSDRWDETDFAFEFDKAPEWDGHTSEDVLKRLKEI